MRSLIFILVSFIMLTESCSNDGTNLPSDASSKMNTDLLSFDYVALRDSSKADSGLATSRISKIDVSDTILIRIEHQTSNGPCFEADVEINGDTIKPKWVNTCPEQANASLTIYELNFAIRNSGIDKDKITVILPD